MTNRLIEKYEEKLMKLTLLKGIDEKCQIHNAKTYAKKEAYSEIIEDLEVLDFIIEHLTKGGDKEC